MIKTLHQARNIKIINRKLGISDKQTASTSGTLGQSHISGLNNV